ncbi:hypothetical protein BV25DRAFT_1921231 [Artomyces pyxidatus]|uniref:Uncharacterized protein n=1 Tax=Artomyces pyxidatus TaxID=48021 RepID=A0ACB8SI83_9AGAM|nr:hypothetical protein BV25DRAFT_1921231 [Artomyces pyxidatus]
MAAMSADVNEGKKTKIRLQDFKLPVQRTIADLGNKHMRAVISLANGFPSPKDKADLAWKSAEEACKSDKFLHKELKKIKATDQTLCGQLIEYINYAAWSMRGDIRKRSLELIRRYFDLENRAKTLGPEKMADLVAWLVPTSPRTVRPFTFGDLDLEARTYDKNKNHGSELIKQVIHAVWFHKKKDPEALRWKEEFSQTPLPLLAMVITAIEAVILEYSSGVHTNMMFTDPLNRDKYLAHLKRLRCLEESAPKYTANLRKSIWEGVLDLTAHYQHLKVDDSDGVSDAMAEQTDFAELEASVA